jgi:hypothetical protein
LKLTHSENKGEHVPAAKPTLILAVGGTTEDGRMVIKALKIKSAGLKARRYMKTYDATRMK